MIEGKANFCQRPNLNLGKDEVEKTPGASQDLFRHCYIVTEDYRLTFYADQNQQTIIYYTSVSGIATKLDEKAKLFIMNRKGSKKPLLKIQSDIESLRKIERFCEEYSDESLQWSPLVYIPSENIKASHTSTSGRKYDIAGSIALVIITSMFAQVQDLINSYIDNNGFLPMHIGTPPPASIIIYAISYLTALTFLMMTFEKLAFKKAISNKTTTILEGFNVLLGFCFPSITV